MDRNQQRTLETFGFAIEELPNLKTTPHMDFVNREGQIIHGLPADSYHMNRYLSRGLKPIIENSKPQNDFVCEVCGKEFKQKIALSGHKRTHTKNLKGG